MRRFYLLALCSLLLTPAYYGQARQEQQSAENIALQKSLLLADLRALDDRVIKLDTRVAAALAKAEIADAAWEVDERWAKELLRSAFELILPERKTSDTPNAATARSPATVAPAELRAQLAVRNRILQIASRDQDLVAALMQEVRKQLGPRAQHRQYAELADFSLQGGDKAAAINYILQAITADPTQTNVAFAILNLAAVDRAAADQLILRYLDQLRATPTALGRQGALGTIYNLNLLMFSPTADSAPSGQPIAPPGAAVMSAYVSYVLDALRQQESIEPGSLKRSRLFLLTAWGPLKTYAPELTGAFLELERLSRRPGEDASLPQVSHLEVYRERNEERIRRNLNSDDPEPAAIDLLIDRGDFLRARKLIDRLAEGAQKARLTEKVNLRKALSLTAKGDLVGAQRLAEALSKANSVVQVYPVMIEKCIAQKDQIEASSLTYQALRQLKRADTAANPLPEGVSSPITITASEFDPILYGLNQLTQKILPINQALGWEVFDELVAAANASSLDTSVARTGIGPGTFYKAAEKNEQHARQLAESLKDQLRQIVALAAIYRWQAAVLLKKEQTHR